MKKPVDPRVKPGDDELGVHLMWSRAALARNKDRASACFHCARRGNADQGSLSWAAEDVDSDCQRALLVPQQSGFINNKTNVKLAKSA
jgi:hypothetical protein